MSTHHSLPSRGGRRSQPASSLKAHLHLLITPPVEQSEHQRKDEAELKELIRSFRNSQRVNTAAEGDDNYPTAA